MNEICIIYCFFHFTSKYLKENVGQNSEIIRVEEEGEMGKDKEEDGHTWERWEMWWMKIEWTGKMNQNDQ